MKYESRPVAASVVIELRTPLSVQHDFGGRG